MGVRSMRVMRRVQACSIICLMLVAACSDQPRISSQQAVEMLQTQSGITLPQGTSVVNYYEGKGRDPQYEHCLWVVFSVSPIEKPPGQRITDGDFRREQLGTYVAALESSMRKRKRIADPKYLYCSEWEKKGFVFRATLIRASDGDYLEVERFRKR